MLLPLLRATRPHQWLKNLFVAAPLVFARRVDDPSALARTLLAVAGFCLLSSAVYLLNDIVDADKDRAHPRKRLRPIASGALPVAVARVAAALGATAGLGATLALSSACGGVAAGYLALNLAYSFRLKRVAFVDVACIALGFLLRVLGGALAVPVAPSGWLLACTLLLASLLGFGKRAHELRTAADRASTQRDVLDRYRPRVLRSLLYALAALTTVTYAAYTQSAHALGFFGTRRLALTVPLVAFGIARFLWITSRSGDADSPTDSMLRDRLFLANLLAYAAAIVAIIY